MYPHAIRLRGPWELAAPRRRRLTMPCRWEDVAAAQGTVRFVRRFGYPGRIDTFERVWLALTGLNGVATVTLNGHPLGEHDGATGPFESDVTALLRERNEMAVEFAAPPPAGPVWDEAGLEIRRSAFLRSVRFWVERSAGEEVIRAAGLVVGSSDRPLELYLLHGNRTVGYITIDPSAEGRPFELASEPASPKEKEAPCRVELVDAATVWYFVESADPERC